MMRKYWSRTPKKSIRTMLIATIGPKSHDLKTIKAMAEKGINIFRSNFSHCTYSEYRDRVRHIRMLSKKLGKPIETLQDLQGPRIRVGALPEEGIELYEGEKRSFVFTRAGKKLNGSIPIDDPYLHADIKKSDPLYLANGTMELKVLKVNDGRIYAKVIRGGRLFSHKGINVPKTVLARGSLTPKDIRDVKRALAIGVDQIALSFVQSAKDIVRLRKLIGRRNVRIIAKIERQVALDNIDEIIRAADGIMIARGDLGIELPLEEVPVIQKNLIRQAHWHGKPAIVATHMLSSMIEHSEPTRAEVSDVANAVLDGADAVMLSDETAVGAYPLRVVEILRRIVGSIEHHLLREENFFDIGNNHF